MAVVRDEMAATFKDSGVYVLCGCATACDVSPPYTRMGEVGKPNDDLGNGIGWHL